MEAFPPPIPADVRVALFITCLADAMFPEVGRATVTLLERLGHQVTFPIEQTCCGQMHANSGYSREARTLSDRFERIFGDAEAIVAPSSSCVAHVRHYCPGIATQTFELSEFIANRLGIDDVGATYHAKVVYHPTCHSLRLANIGDAPLRLLRRVRGLELCELPNREECCGFGGTFSVKNAETSSAMAADKCAAIESTGAEVCTAADSSCLMQIGGALSRAGSSVRAVHFAEILASRP